MTALTPVATTDHSTVAAVRGDGPPVLLIHAIGLDHRMWDAVVERLETSRTTIAYDLRGHSGAEAAPAARSVAQLADDAAAVIAATVDVPAHVVGLSLGGAVAQELALRHPDRVSRLTLAATLCAGLDVARQRAVDAERHGVGSQVEETLQRWFTPGAPASAVDYARQRLEAMGVLHWSASWRALADLDTRERLGDIGVPTRVVAGTLDRSTPVSFAQDIAARIPDAQLAVIADGPHMLSLETPAELAQAIAE